MNDCKSSHQERIETFMRLAGQELPDLPIVPSVEVRRLRAMLILEEALETIEALGFEASVEIQSNANGEHYHDWTLYDSGEPSLIKIADGCADLSVVTIGTLSVCGIADEPILKEVDASNLRKFEPPKCPTCGYKMAREGDRWKCPRFGSFDGRHELPLSDGPHRRADGKWIKATSWRKPDISGVLKAQGYDRG